MAAVEVIAKGDLIMFLLMKLMNMMTMTMSMHLWRGAACMNDM